MIKSKDSTHETLDHINKVRKYIKIFSRKLLDRGECHDASKLKSPEKEAYDEVTFKLKNLTFGSPEYKQTLAQIRPAIDHHYKVNRHHVEFHPNGIRGMSLIDLVEMVMDWKAASERHENGDIHRSLEIQRAKYQINDDIVEIIKNTIEEMGWKK